MQKTVELNISISDRYISIDLPTEDEEILASVFLGLAQYVKKGFHIKVRQTYATFSGTEQVVTRVITKTQQVGEWGKEIKGLISALQKK
jgi:hypothetical protein